MEDWGYDRTYIGLPKKQLILYYTCKAHPLPRPSIGMTTMRSGGSFLLLGGSNQHTDASSDRIYRCSRYALSRMLA